MILITKKWILSKSDLNGCNLLGLNLINHPVACWIRS